MAVTDVSKIATCTSCQFDQDLSNYWTAAIYFKARNGTYKVNTTQHIIQAGFQDTTDTNSSASKQWPTSKSTVPTAESPSTTPPRERSKYLPSSR